MFARNNKSVNNSNVHHVTSCPMKQFLLPLTSAISNDRPRPNDIQKTEELQLVLEANKVFEPECETKHRQEVLKKLTTLLKDWIKLIATAKGVSVESAAKLGGLIMPFGSYQLGVHQSGADIDALCVAPRCIQRDDYFATFLPILKNQSEVTDCRAVEGAYVPIIKMKFDGVEVDLVFARLLRREIPDDLDLSDDTILANLDERCVRSLNGRRVTDAILDLIPNHDVFRQALRAIKLWAKRTGVYSNAMGYFGGVTWAMLVARTCQLYPNAAAATIVHKMFHVFTHWKWPMPMLLTRTDNVADLPFPVWDPRINVGDRYHLMPIITPAYPQQNSTFNVTASTRKVIMTELLRGFNKTKEIMEGRGTWEQLFESPNFFNSYRHFVMMEVNSKTAADHVEWSGLVESKSRFLISNLEQAPHVRMAHINPKSFGAKNTDVNGSTDFSSMWFIGLEFAQSNNMSIQLADPIARFVTHVNEFAEKIKMLKPGMTVKAVYVNRWNLNQYLGADVLNPNRKNMQPLSAKLGKENIDSQLYTRVEKRSSDEEIYNPPKVAKKWF